jgi:monoamine oxidase
MQQSAIVRPTQIEPEAERRPTVAIVGAGISGLSAAYRLSQVGWDVTVFERQGRIGGRALTFGRPISAGLIAQCGPARFPGMCERVFSLARVLGVPMEPFYPTSGMVVGFFGGARVAGYEPTEAELWGFDAEARRFHRRLLAPLERLALRTLNRPARGTLRFSRGTSAFAEALADAADADIRLRSKVSRIHQCDDRVDVTFTSWKDPAHTESFDYAICAVPISVLAEIELSPALSNARRDAIDTTPFSAAGRVFVEMDKPFWRDAGFNGFAVTDTIGEIWDPHWARPVSPALLVCYSQGEIATRLHGMDEQARAGFVIDNLERVFPGASQHVIRTVSFFWRDQPWVRGGWPLLRDGLESNAAAFRTAEGRLFFAGDYASDAALLNTVEGALESSDHVVAQLTHLHGGYLSGAGKRRRPA